MSTVPTPATPVPAAAPVTAPTTSALPGVKVLLEGGSGTGKTYSIGTLVESGLEVAFLATEQGYETLYGYFTDKGKPVPPNLFVHEVAGPSAGFDTMVSAAQMVNALSYEALIKSTDSNRNKYDQLVKLLQALNNFTDQRTGRQLGSVDSWGTNRALVIDGMTGLSNCAMNLFVGGRIAIDQKDWGLGQRNLENLLRKLTACRCHFILLGHIEREAMVDGSGAKLTVSTLGKALAPKIPAMFSDVVLAKREAGPSGQSWVWDTMDPLADLKTRNLPYSNKLAPDFRAIIEKWKARGGVMETKP